MTPHFTLLEAQSVEMEAGLEPEQEPMAGLAPKRLMDSRLTQGLFSFSLFFICSKLAHFRHFGAGAELGAAQERGKGSRAEIGVLGAHSPFLLLWPA